ncbi:MAG: hypothetical protein M1608_18285 [Candidatus Omnitrophica bacterium]|nr:hypothetical protein [Candidatus Omnitrophota bacterium]
MRLASISLGFAVFIASLPGKGASAAGADEASPAQAPAAAAVSAPAIGTSITSAYSPRDGQWHIDWPGRLSQHDVVYLSPPEDPSLGLPIGNGDMGALLWTTDHELIMAINKCDTWDDSPPGDFDNWGLNEEENYTSLRHCGRLVLDFGCPVFDLLYQKDFQARIDLASARASLHAITPFAQVNLASYASADHRVLVLRGETSGTEGYPRQARLERWGSRVFGHWYSLVVRDANLGLGGTSTSIEQNRILITQKLRSLWFVLAAQVIPDGQTKRDRS